ncbi:hypothetical protein [Burkholderia sp. LAS2]|uniref:hypothetical protein n=1 Tax=Burkholderia sp. LAS2 TaxID=2813843 RepID=UPI001BCFC17C|nr:hypothetical protein [Burkholderia sp. LAS2]QVN14797.1 hypothetical protein JYG37_22095 [Burkholderia sp. LAS2]
MSVATADLLSAAQRIFNTGSCEADWRNVGSRAYYAVYHDIQGFADGLAAAAFPGNIPAGTKSGMHHHLYTGLLNPTVPKSDPRNKQSFTLGVMAKNLHSERIKADYTLGVAVSQIEASNNLATARNILAVIAGQPVGSPLAKFGGTSTSGNTTTPKGTQSTQSPAPASTAHKRPGQGPLKIIK